MSEQDIGQIGSWPSYDESNQARCTMHASTDQPFHWHANGERSTDTVKVFEITDLPDLQHNVVRDSIDPLLDANTNYSYEPLQRSASPAGLKDPVKFARSEDRATRSRPRKAPNPLRKWSPTRLRKLCRSERPRNLPQNINFDQVEDINALPICDLVDGYDLASINEHLANTGPVNVNLAVGERLPIFSTDADLTDLPFETPFRLTVTDESGWVMVDMQWSTMIPREE